jgi:hypothetical protein
VKNEQVENLRFTLTLRRGVPAVIAETSEICVPHLFPGDPTGAITWFERRTGRPLELGSRSEVLQGTEAAKQ